MSIRPAERVGPASSWSDLATFYRSHLLEEVMPFWLRHALDDQYGGIFTGIGDDGVINTENKFVWSNARAIYTFAALYDRIERNEKWLDAARSIAKFCLAHGRDEHGIWGFLTDRQGRMIEGEKAIQVDAFAIMGLVEFARASGDEQALQAALETYRSTRERLAKPGSYGDFPYPLPPGAKAHRDHFQFALAWYELATLTGETAILADAFERAEGVMCDFRRPEDRVLLEYVGLDGNRIDSPAGRTMVPGHAIESMWFMIHLYRDVGWTERIEQACDTMLWGLERGWDPQFGGVLLGIDVEGREPIHWKNPDKKLWWVHAEALYALLLAFEHTGNRGFLEWYWKVHDWTFRHFPVPGHGEWTNRLDRTGEPIDTVIALPVKDPFHLPRALILCIDVLERLDARAHTPQETP